jgi:CRISPR-associated protein Cmr2
VSEVFWQAKIWGLLHDPAIKALHDNSGHDSNSFWQQLEVMQPWRDKGWNPEDANAKLLQHIHLADYITSASDRGAIGSVSRSVNYAPSHNRDKGLEISHLLSGSKLHFKIPQHWQVISDRKTFLQQQEKKLLEIIPNEAKTDIKRLFWWLWRCLPQATCDLFGDDSLLLMPAETRLPDSSIWSHASLTAALAGALAGYDLIITDLESEWSSDKTLSHPYLATFSFSPVQELIKASRKMRDFWAGSWILHYLSATVCWKLARQYGADSLLYPSLYQQPLIDHWLLQQYPEFNQWVKQPSERSLLTAGFPNVLVLVLPKDKVSAAMQTAKQTLLETWRDLGKKVFQQLNNQQKKHQWMSNLHDNSSTWDGWLDAQWQTYWSAIPIGKEGESIKNAAIPAEREAELQLWLDTQNNAYGLTQKNELFHPHELDFLRAAYQQPLEKRGRNFSVNVGSWWPHIFDQTRYALSAVKNARTWLVPTAFGPRSTISGIGSVVHPGADWVTEGDTKKYWQRQVGLFDGTEQLNATETLKRGLEKVLPQLLKGTASQPTEEEIADIIAASYPDLTAGVAGYLNSYANADVNHRRYFHLVC